MKTESAPRPLDRLASRAAAWVRDKLAATRLRRSLKRAARSQE